MKKYSFFYHYNKPLSKKHGETVLTIHFRNSCMAVNSIICKVNTETKERKHQPHCVVWGKCSDIVIKDRIATII